ncbi:hypothetical protein [Thermus antranikianii]|nr:hypothetical protein [Thermus antranikianii]QWK20815.1 MAG: hypothetical protein KNN15_06995 [Thermus antranikianii]
MQAVQANTPEAGAPNDEAGGPTEEAEGQWPEEDEGLEALHQLAQVLKG